MRKGLLTAMLSSGAILLSTIISAQSADRSYVIHHVPRVIPGEALNVPGRSVVYAMTDVTNQNGNWVYLRVMNMDKADYSNMLFDGVAPGQIAFDAISKKQITELPTTIADRGFDPRPAFNSGVAAMALDSKHDRIWFTPMFVDQLRYYDLKTQQMYYVTGTALTGKTQKTTDQGNIVTRMVIAADGNGYAMTNDATQLIQFTTGKKPQITDLGAIVDDPANKNISIHNSCSSYGGDMIADDDGNLYIFTARNNIFKVNIETRVATYVGAITGLPSTFTVNGAAVNENNDVLIATAGEPASLYTVNVKTLVATPVQAQGQLYHTSDLAGSNLLASGKNKNNSTIDLLTRNEGLNDNRISIYPNPVTNNQFTVQFSNVTAGNYTVQVTDMMGRQLVQQAVSIGSDNQAQSIKLNSSFARGMYLVKVVDPASKAIFSTKIVLQ